MARKIPANERRSYYFSSYSGSTKVRDALLTKQGFETLCRPISRWSARVTGPGWPNDNFRSSRFTKGYKRVQKSFFFFPISSINPIPTTQADHNIRPCIMVYSSGSDLSICVLVPTCAGYSKLKQDCTTKQIRLGYYQCAIVSV